MAASSKKITLTKKLQLLINSNDPDFKRQVLDTLYSWQHMCFRSANYIVTHHFIQDRLSDLFYINEGTKIKLTNIEKDADGVLSTSRLNTTYQVLSGYFKKELPSDIFTNLNTAIVGQYNRDWKEIVKGEKLLPQFHREMPMPIKGRSIKELKKMEGKKDYSFTLFKIPFRTYLGHQRWYDNAEFLEKLADGSLKLCDSAIQLKRGKIFLLANFSYFKEQCPMNPAIVAEVSLSTEFPLLVKIGKHAYRIGNREEYLHRRLAIQQACKRVQKTVNFQCGGHGKKRKFRAHTQYRDIERNYIDNRLHVYSRRLMEICVKHQAGMILLVNQEEKEERAKEDAFLLRNWSYGDLKSKIDYKAAKQGITVIVE